MSTSNTRRNFLRRSAALAATAGIAQAALGDPVTTPRPKKRIKVGQIGVGHAHARGKMDAYRRSDEYEVVGVVETNDKLRAAAQRSKTYEGLPFLTREQLLNVDGLQVVAVETEVRDLLENAEACIDAGMHIHLDKPAGESLSHFRRILTKAERKKLCVQMGYMYRYNPAVHLLRQFLGFGWLGEIFEVHAVMSKVVGAGTRKGLAEYPGGILFELGCHIVDLVVGVLGTPDKVTAFPRSSGAHDDGLVDNMLAVLEYPKATATVKSAAIEVEGFARRHLVVCGTEGTFHIQPHDSPKVRVALSKKRGEFEKGYQDVSMPRYVRYVDDAADLAKIVRGEEKHRFPPSHDLAVQETVLRGSGLEID